MNNKIRAIITIVAVAAVGQFIAYQICHVPKQAQLVAFLALVFIYPIMRFPIVGIYAFFMVSPFIPFIRRLYYLAHGRPGIDPLIVIGDIIVLLVFVGLFFEFKDRTVRSSTSKFFALAITCYIAYMVIRTFAFNINPVSENIGKLKYYAPTALLFFIGMLYAREDAHLKRICSLTFVMGLFAALYGIKQLFFGYSMAEKFWFSSISFTTLFIKGIARPFSFFQSPAGFADYLLVGIACVLMVHSLATYKRGGLLLLLIPLFYYGILITSVRSDWIGAAAFIITWFVFFELKKNSQRIAVIAVSVLIVFFYQIASDSVTSKFGLERKQTATMANLGKQEYINLMVTSRAKAITNPFEEHSMLSRFALWEYMFQLSSDPVMALLGRGVGALNADSLYITYLAEFGYPGFIFVVWLFCAFIVKGIRFIDRAPESKEMVFIKGVVCLDLALALMNITGTHVHAFPGDAYFWFFNGVAIGKAAYFQATMEERGNS